MTRLFLSPTTRKRWMCLNSSAGVESESTVHADMVTFVCVSGCMCTHMCLCLCAVCVSVYTFRFKLCVLYVCTVLTYSPSAQICTCVLLSFEGTTM